MVRITIDHFNLPAEEISSLWAEQDKYIDLLESKLRKARQQKQFMKSRSKIIEKNYWAYQRKVYRDTRLALFTVAEKMAQLEKLDLSPPKKEPLVINIVSSISI